MQEPDFWDDADNSQRIMKEVKGLKDVLETMQGLLQAHEDILLLIEMAYEENDASVIEELETEIAAFEEKFEDPSIFTRFCSIILYKIYISSYIIIRCI